MADFPPGFTMAPGAPPELVEQLAAITRDFDRADRALHFGRSLELHSTALRAQASGAHPQIVARLLNRALETAAEQAVARLPGAEVAEIRGALKRAGLPTDDVRVITLYLRRQQTLAEQGA